MAVSSKDKLVLPHDDQVETHGDPDSSTTTSSFLKSPYYKPLMLPSGKVVDITKRNQFIRDWKAEYLKCDKRPYIVLLVSFCLLFTVMYTYTYHQAVLFTIIEKFQPKTTSSVWDPRNLDQTSEFTFPVMLDKSETGSSSAPTTEQGTPDNATDITTTWVG